MTIGELKQILGSCDLIIIKDNIIKFVIAIFGHRGNYSCPMFHLKSSLLGNQITKISITSFNKYLRNMYFIGLGYDCGTKLVLKFICNSKNHVSVAK